jgi:hypothetical protein
VTDEEYKRLLAALALKHLRAPRAVSPPGDPNRRELRPQQLDDVSSLARLVNAAASDPRQDPELMRLVRRRLQQDSPVAIAASALDESGILDALDDASPLVFAEFRRDAIPEEDLNLLRRAGFTEAEVEVLIAVAVDHAHRWTAEKRYFPCPPPMRSAISLLESAAETLREAADKIPEAAAETPKKKRKLFNGIGKILGGTVMGVGNALAAAGTIAAPNPATGSIAIASGAAALTSILAGVGDLTGE